MSRFWKGFFASVVCCAAGLAAAAPQNLELFARRPLDRMTVLNEFQAFVQQHLGPGVGQSRQPSSATDRF